MASKRAKALSRLIISPNYSPFPASLLSLRSFNSLWAIILTSFPHSSLPQRKKKGQKWGNGKNNQAHHSFHSLFPASSFVPTLSLRSCGPSFLHPFTHYGPCLFSFLSCSKVDDECLEELWAGILPFPYKTKNRGKKGSPHIVLQGLSSTGTRKEKGDLLFGVLWGLIILFWRYGWLYFQGQIIPARLY